MQVVCETRLRLEVMIRQLGMPSTMPLLGPYGAVLIFGMEQSKMTSIKEKQCHHDAQELQPLRGAFVCCQGPSICAAAQQQSSIDSFCHQQHGDWVEDPGTMYLGVR